MSSDLPKGNFVKDITEIWRKSQGESNHADLTPNIENVIKVIYKNLSYSMCLFITGQSESIYVTVPISMLSTIERQTLIAHLKQSCWAVLNCDKDYLKIAPGVESKEDLKLGAFYEGKWCMACDCPTDLVDISVVNPHRSGCVYMCPKCQSYVGCHKGEYVSLGSVANKALRDKRSETHNYIDTFWRQEYISRTKLYHLMSVLLKIPKARCHVGMFSIEQCDNLVKKLKECEKEIKLNGNSPEFVQTFLGKESYV